MTISRNHFTYETSRLHGTDHLARENVNFAWRALANVEDSAVLFRIVFHHANGETRAYVNSILRCRNAEAAIRAHGCKPREGCRLKIGLVQYPGVGLGNRFAGVCCGPMIRIFRRAKQRTRRAPVRIKGSERTIHYD